MSEVAPSRSPLTSLATRSPSAVKPASIERIVQNEGTGFGRLLQGLGRQIDRGERSVSAALGSATRGAELGPNELLALQAGIYRYSEAVDLAAKLVDRVGSGVKTVVAGQ